MTSQREVNEPTSRGDDQMFSSREELQDALYEYTTESLEDADKVGKFCARLSEWIKDREKDLKVMKDIKDRSEKIDPKFSQVAKSKSKGKAFLQFAKNKVSLCSASSRRAELEEELAAALKDTLGGLEELHCFLDAVERMAVTSVHVLSENQVLHLPKGISFEHFQVVVTAAQGICPLLLKFKGDPETFFLPKLQNLEVLSRRLEKYKETTQKIYENFEKRPVDHLCQTKPESDIYVNLSEDDMQGMHHRVNELLQIRRNEHWRMVFLFQEEPCRSFIREFNKRSTEIQEFIETLEMTADQLDKMEKGAKISRVASSSVGAAGSVLSIVGLALTPVTAGLSLGLAVAGAGLGIAHGVTSAVTTAAEIKVKHKQQKKVSKTFKPLMEDVQAVQACLDRITTESVSIMTVSESDVVQGVGCNEICDMFIDVVGIGGNIGTVVDGAADVPQVFAEVGEAAASASLIAVSAVSLGGNIFSICKNSRSLAKGTRSEVSQSIRARAKLLEAEVRSWKMICDFLVQGLSKSKESKAILDAPFYPEKVKKHRDAKSTADDMEDKEQAHVEDKQTCEEDKRAHVEDKQTCEEDKRAQKINEPKEFKLKAKSKYTQEADKQDQRHVHHSRWIMKLSSVLVNLLNPAGPFGGSVITSYGL